MKQVDPPIEEIIYMDLLSFLAKYDATLNNHFIDSTTFRGTSNRVQNDLIKCTADVVMDHIKSEIKKAHFLSIALDETTNVANLSQLSIFVVYWMVFLKSDS
ncbi:unnamed protein product [Psylliodes chrysocephalus]|uniref:DUF4371 domain-containing protein n=1 Tax=Psylliodes chrysocephalus TaxID=3402493 RepID=A0A9P0GIG0_9CUCU|nr:unnamed protein product [Psylliodes chrysocephala]